MFIHAVTGCDTISRIFGIGKKTAFQKFVKGDPVLQSFANAFTVPNQTPEVIDDLGSQVMAILFGGKCTDSLVTMRYNIFSKRVVSASSPVTPERLPPTESTTKLHCRRAYYQIMVWMGKEEGMDAMNWGWNLQDDRFIPLMTNMNAAPESLLKIHNMSLIVDQLESYDRSNLEVIRIEFAKLQKKLEDCQSLKESPEIGN
ncbi:hypothetical protein SKAU_G00338210 [Synaphobranchus kaupii]|uniref:Uncharacterized protein n=1 Tax=Synaphobranchus kaupii TaxID=118154 RepID=A0A9Q1EMN7_SYNKA|nr:hypothetical protein SKAU_G00338210 [Synaphobranchus kaupii]